jgi:four helix bundle protein
MTESLGSGQRQIVCRDESLEFVVEVYRLTRAFPPSERYGLAAQIRRSAVSILANITEGYARFGARQLRSFIEIAYGSARECEALLLVATRVDLLDGQTSELLQSRLATISKRLLGLLRSLRNR